MRKVNVKTQPLVDVLMAILDTDGNSSIDNKEWSAKFPDVAFKSIDTDNSGFIDAKELKVWCPALARTFSDLDNGDGNKDGKLSRHEMGNLDNAGCDKIFALLDKNGDMEIEISEIVSLAPERLTDGQSGVRRGSSRRARGRGRSAKRGGTTKRGSSKRDRGRSARRARGRSARRR
jgi:hypothetical protein